SIGAYSFGAGPAIVEMTDDANGYVLADAVRFTYVGPAPPQFASLPDRTVAEDGTAGGVPTALAPAFDGTPAGESYMLFEEWGGAWTDAEKSPANSEDDLMCWAAAAANILEWTGWGLVDGMTDSDDIFGYFQDHWTDEGSLMEFGWDWWFDGTNPTEGWADWAQVDVAGGGFFPDEDFNDYYVRQGNDSLALDAIHTYLTGGYGVGLGLYGPGGHGITCWGVNYDPLDPANFYGIWVTDSDDSKYTTSPPDQFRYFDVQESEGKWFLQDYYGTSNWYIGEVQGLALNRALLYDLRNFASDPDTPVDQLTFAIVGNTSPECGARIEDGHVLLLEPQADWNGASTLTIEVSDGTSTDTASFAVTVTPVNDAPTVTTPIADVAVLQDAPDMQINLAQHFGDIDVGDTLACAVEANANPACVTTSIAGTTLTLHYPAGGTGTSAVAIRATDSAGAHVDETFTVTVSPVQPLDSGPVIVVAPERGPAPLDIHAIALDVDPDTNILWRFGDGATANGPIVSHTYPSPGLYTLSVTVGGQTVETTIVVH
ncbi:PKD domain-containing protein, partial [bacterium]|nr:PKD domain-containing protein [bacterium]